MPLLFTKSRMPLNYNILFLYTNLSTFVAGDRDILGQYHNVTEYKIDNSTPLKLIISQIKLLFYLLFNTHRFSLLYVWFADYHSLLPIIIFKIFKKKSLIVAGGYDTCRAKKYGYGSFINPIRGFCAINSFKYATHTLAVSNHMARIIKYIAPKSHTITLYNGVQYGSAYEIDQKKEENTILCVSIITTKQSYYIKGIDRFIMAAALLPQVKFTLIGCSKEKLESFGEIIPSNMTIIPKIPQEMLPEYYQRCKVYCQLSRYESFCLSLAEAMLFGATPLISNTGGMPMVAGPKAIIVNEFTKEEISTKFEEALKIDSPQEYSSRVKSIFSIQNRSDQLEKILNNLR